MTKKTSRRSDAGREDQPTWQPLAAVGTLTSIVTEQLEHTRTQLALMEQARPSRPDARILDDHTVAETLRVYGQMAQDYRALFAEQGRRWQAQTTLSATQRAQVDAYVEWRSTPNPPSTPPPPPHSTQPAEDADQQPARIPASPGRRDASLRPAPLRTVRAARHRTRLSRPRRAVGVAVLGCCVGGRDDRVGRRRGQDGSGPCPVGRVARDAPGSRWRSRVG
jgi:hypothetical protein